MSTAFAQAENPEQTVRSFIQDSSTTIAVKSKIAEDPKLSQMALSIETINGIVQISGIARSEADKEKITELTQQVQGVSKIHNLIRIKPSTF